MDRFKQSYKTISREEKRKLFHINNTGNLFKTRATKYVTILSLVNVLTQSVDLAKTHEPL